MKNHHILFIAATLSLAASNTMAWASSQGSLTDEENNGAKSAMYHNSTAPAPVQSISWTGWLKSFFFSNPSSIVQKEENNTVFHPLPVPEEAVQSVDSAPEKKSIKRQPSLPCSYEELLEKDKKNKVLSALSKETPQDLKSKPIKKIKAQIKSPLNTARSLNGGR